MLTFCVKKPFPNTMKIPTRSYLPPRLLPFQSRFFDACISPNTSIVAAVVAAREWKIEHGR